MVKSIHGVPFLKGTVQQPKLICKQSQSFFVSQRTSIGLQFLSHKHTCRVSPLSSLKVQPCQSLCPKVSVSQSSSSTSSSPTILAPCYIGRSIPPCWSLGFLSLLPITLIFCHRGKPRSWARKHVCSLSFQLSDPGFPTISWCYITPSQKQNQS